MRANQSKPAPRNLAQPTPELPVSFAGPEPVTEPASTPAPAATESISISLTTENMMRLKNLQMTLAQQFGFMPSLEQAIMHLAHSAGRPQLGLFQAPSDNVRFGQPGQFAPNPGFNPSHPYPSFVPMSPPLFNPNLQAAYPAGYPSEHLLPKKPKR